MTNWRQEWDEFKKRMNTPLKNLDSETKVGLIVLLMIQIVVTMGFMIII